MELGAFYTEGSNRIKVTIYSDSESPIVVNLLNSNVSDSSLSILDDSSERINQLSKYIDRSIIVEPHNLTEGQAEVYFNFLDFDVSSYMVEAIQDGVDKLVNVNTIEVVDAVEQPYHEDHLSDIQNVEPTNIEGEMFNEIPGDPIIDIDFESDEIILKGDADIEYQGGGNRYLIDDNGLLVKQVKSCESINDRYSPFQLNTTIKCEKQAGNLFQKFNFNSYVYETTGEVQKGLQYKAYKATGNDKTNIWFDLKLNGTFCFSVLMAAEHETKATISINSVSKDIVITNEYYMFYVTSPLSDDSRFKIECQDNTKIFVLLPQVERGSYPTSRIIPGKVRDKDMITIASEDCNVVFNPEGGEEVIGGFVNLKFRAGREFSSNNCLIDWRNDSNEGLIIYQDNTNSILASFGDGYTVRSLPVVMEEGEEYEVRVQWDTECIGIQINDEEPVLIQCAVPFPEEYPTEIKVGWSHENYDSLNSDVISLQIGQ